MCPRRQASDLPVFIIHSRRCYSRFTCLVHSECVRQVRCWNGENENLRLAYTAPDQRRRGLQQRLAWFDRDRSLVRHYSAAASIHSHTNQSHESLAFIERILNAHPLLRSFLRQQRATAHQRSALEIDFQRAYWTPPLTPRAAFELEKDQIELRLGLEAMVSLSDHDSIEAPLLLRIARPETPVSLEWTVPFQTSTFHLGVHHLPPARAQRWMSELAACTQQPSTARVCDTLRALAAEPDVLLIFNHPLWNLHGTPPAEFAQNVEDFLALNNATLHAFELNGMRRWEENARTVELAERWRQIVVSGGDRHGCEPNANVNLTRARCFAEWVREIRVERRSTVLFMPQYNDSFVARCYQTFLDAVRYTPQQGAGATQWDQRTFHPDRDGQMRPLSELWRAVPPVLQTILGLARLAETTSLLTALRVVGGRSVPSPRPERLERSIG